MSKSIENNITSKNVDNNTFETIITSTISTNTISNLTTTSFNLSTDAKEGYVLTSDADGNGVWDALPTAEIPNRLIPSRYNSLHRPFGHSVAPVGTKSILYNGIASFDDTIRPLTNGGILPYITPSFNGRSNVIRFEDRLGSLQLDLFDEFVGEPEMTMSCWLYIPSDVPIIRFFSGVSQNSIISGQNVNVRLWRRGPGANPNSINPQNFALYNYTPDTWFHFAFSVSRYTGSRVWGNGVFIGSYDGSDLYEMFPFEFIPPPNINTASRTHSTYENIFLNNFSRTEGLQGAIDGIFFINKVLTDNEISNIYNNNIYPTTSVIALNADLSSSVKITRPLSYTGSAPTDGFVLTSDVDGNASWQEASGATYTAGTGLTLTGTEFTTNDGEIDHNNLLNYVANQHIDWTTSGNATADFKTTGFITSTRLNVWEVDQIQPDAQMTVRSPFNRPAIRAYLSGNNPALDILSLESNIGGGGTIQFSVKTDGNVFSRGNIEAKAITLTDGATDGYVLTSDASGNASWTAPVDTNTTYTAGTGLTLTGTEFTTDDSKINHNNLLNYVANQHIDWTNATSPFETNITDGTAFTIRNANEDVIMNVNTLDPLTRINGRCHVSWTNEFALRIRNTDNTVECLRIDTENPLTQIISPLQYTGSTPVDGYVLTSDASGNASWTAPTSGSSSSQTFGFEITNSNTATTIAVAGTYVKAETSNLTSNMYANLVWDRDSPSVNNRMRYIGTETGKFVKLVGYVCLQSSTNNQIVSARFAKNGTPINGSPAETTIGTSGHITTMTMIGYASVETNDYFEIFITTKGGTNSITLTQANIVGELLVF